MKKMAMTGSALLALSLQAVAAESAPSNAELYEIIQAQQSELETLKSAGASTSNSDTTIGGYGELHYNMVEGGDDEMDFHRFVLFFNHQFNDRTKLVTELEVEHSLAGDGKPGEVELEQAYIDFALNDSSNIKAGLFLMPVGIINETHEPPVFYGVERNPIEKNIIPTTWWEAGAAYSKRMDNGLSFDVGVHSGLDVDPTTYSVRGGRQKVAEAKANELAQSARLRYTGVAGLELAASVVHQSDIVQDNTVSGGSATLFETHAVWNTGHFTLKALYAQWTLDGQGAEAANADKQMGYYLEPSYRVNEQWGVFTRYNEWDLLESSAADTAVNQTDLGVNYWPHPDVVVKADVQWNDAEAKGTPTTTAYNVGVGYQF